MEELEKAPGKMSSQVESICKISEEEKNESSRVDTSNENNGEKDLSYV